jgi:hypothetical protein
MCAPVTVATGGVSGGCTGICQIVPQITGLVALVGVLAWNFKGLLRRGLGFTKTGG